MNKANFLQQALIHLSHPFVFTSKAIKPIKPGTCRFRTEKGYCTRSHRTCPATVFTLTFNQ